MKSSQSSKGNLACKSDNKKSAQFRKNKCILESKVFPTDKTSAFLASHGDKLIPFSFTLLKDTSMEQKHEISDGNIARGTQKKTSDSEIYKDEQGSKFSDDAVATESASTKNSDSTYEQGLKNVAIATNKNGKPAKGEKSGNAHDEGMGSEPISHNSSNQNGSITVSSPIYKYDDIVSMLYEPCKDWVTKSIGNFGTPAPTQHAKESAEEAYKIKIRKKKGAEKKHINVKASDNIVRSKTEKKSMINQQPGEAPQVHDGGKYSSPTKRRNNRLKETIKHQFTLKSTHCNQVIGGLNDGLSRKEDVQNFVGCSDVSILSSSGCTSSATVYYCTSGGDFKIENNSNNKSPVKVSQSPVKFDFKNASPKRVKHQDNKKKSYRKEANDPSNIPCNCPGKSSKTNRCSCKPKKTFKESGINTSPGLLFNSKKSKPADPTTPKLQEIFKHNSVDYCNLDLAKRNNEVHTDELMKCTKSNRNADEKESVDILHTSNSIDKNKELKDIGNPETESTCMTPTVAFNSINSKNEVVSNRLPLFNHLKSSEKVVDIGSECIPESALPKVKAGSKMRSDSLKQINNKEFKPLIDYVDCKEISKNDTKEKLAKFNLGNEMTYTLYGTSYSLNKTDVGNNGNDDTKRGFRELHQICKEEVGGLMTFDDNKVNTRDILDKFNLGNDMTDAIYGRSNNVDKSNVQDTSKFENKATVQPMAGSDKPGLKHFPQQSDVSGLPGLNPQLFYSACKPRQLGDFSGKLGDVGVNNLSGLASQNEYKFNTLEPSSIPVPNFLPRQISNPMLQDNRYYGPWADPFLRYYPFMNYGNLGSINPNELTPFYGFGNNLLETNNINKISGRYPEVSLNVNSDKYDESSSYLKNGGISAMDSSKINAENLTSGKAMADVLSGNSIVSHKCKVAPQKNPVIQTGKRMFSKAGNGMKQKDGKMQSKERKSDNQKPLNRKANGIVPGL